MKYFCGIYQKRNPEQFFPVPTNSKKLDLGERHLFYLCGKWRLGEIRRFKANGAELLIVGDCFLDDKDIEKWLRQAIKNQRYATLTEIPGDYNLIIFDQGCLFLFTDMASLRPLFFVETENYHIYSSNQLPLMQLFQQSICSKDTDPSSLLTLFDLPNHKGNYFEAKCGYKIPKLKDFNFNNYISSIRVETFAK
ncbi:hypothetical protein SAMN05444392_103193 [Seinonella peptonophila]|uniref:Uncharacterized protein n=1 Tax=Seinonella peptonophila TaxID=112248 RepID=A0A1M4WFJ5_9BACL|nr:hypothetical protein [Seinonella peptonophila]SHE79843.1 hypothetical protein SAMN05444392_103193 [Seinonella peptonophila]